jgi:hypothetical protein
VERPVGIRHHPNRSLPKWLGWAILVITAANLVAVWVPIQLQYVIGGLPGLWTLAAGMIMLHARPASTCPSPGRCHRELRTDTGLSGAVDRHGQAGQTESGNRISSGGLGIPRTTALIPCDYETM